MIGHAAATRWRAGVDVLLVDINAEARRAARSVIGGGRVKRRRRSKRALLDTRPVLQKFGRIDAFFNNAALKVSST
jgi:hypothetical protein